MIDAVTLKKSFVRESRSAVTTGKDLARYLVAEYLHDWGLRDPDIVAAESRRIVEQAEALTMTGAGEVSEHELCAAAIHITMEEVEASIARMAATSIRDQLAGSPTSNSIVPRMARVLLEFPDAIRHRDRPPARLLQVLERSVAPIIPRCHPREMRPQPSTRLWSVLRRSYWLELCGSFQSWVCRCVGVK
ncbi:hypothetical protein [Planctomicrobium piriforme]|uniref:Uncharacterized protein n=1 Tax=Planctomicrobium piriforme TaxID=1576369 RepID=A0A1I3DEG4_9PLAN|nr:hypothetical protein [Planctomicrobium piriforme]SFH85105.1 hypothetical protein SAMN05421753_103204 [Planctomicrobium piriforme]